MLTKHITMDDLEARLGDTSRIEDAEVVTDPSPAAGDEKPDNPMKYDSGKTPIHLLPTIPLFAIAKVFGFGAKKYAQNSWRSKNHKAVSWMRTYGSIISHLLLWAAGQDNDDESGMSHLWHAGTQLLILINQVETGSGADDRFHDNPEHLKELRGSDDPRNS